MSRFEVGDLIVRKGSTENPDGSDRIVRSIWTNSKGEELFTFESLKDAQHYTHWLAHTTYVRKPTPPKTFEVGKRYRKPRLYGWLYHCVYATEKVAVLAAFYSNEPDGKFVSDSLGSPTLGVYQKDRDSWTATEQ